MANSLIGTLVFLVGLPVAAEACYLFGLVAACARHRPPTAGGPPRSQIVILVPAHNEADTIASCLESMLSQQYPRDLFRVVVIADNCTDQTAARAAATGAEVMVRDIPEIRGKGHALQWAMEQLLAGSRPFDAVVVADADSRADPRFLAELETLLGLGHDVVQADYSLEPEPDSARSQIEAAAMLLRVRVRYTGLTTLGLPVGLAGNGMLLSRRVLQSIPWDAYSPTEDAEYTLKLLLAGVRPVFAARARISSPTTPSERGAYTQGLRWESGRFTSMRRSLPTMLRAAAGRRDLVLLASSIDIAVPPFTILISMATLGTVGALVLVMAGGSSALPLVPWLFAALALPAYVVLGLRAAGAPAPMYRALLSLPGFVRRKLRVYGHLLFHGVEQSWVRTQRPAELHNEPD